MNEDDFFKRFFGGGSGSGSLGNDFANFESLMLNDFNRIFNLDEMFRQFDAFQNFEIIDKSNRINPPLAIDEIPNGGAKRDKFLKPQTPGSSDEKSKPRSFYDFGVIQPLDPKRNDIQNRSDEYFEDLDEKIAKEGLDKVLRNDIFKNNNISNLNPHRESSMFDNRRPMISAFGQSVSVRRVQRPDGSVEEMKTIKKSDGTEENIVTRWIGDKRHSVIEKKLNNAIKETEEVFENFDEKNLDEFNKMWSSSSSFQRKRINPQISDYMNQQKALEPVTEDNNSKGSLISKIFSLFK